MESNRRTGQTVIIMFYAKFSKIVKYSALNKKKTKSLATPISYYVIDKGLVMFSYKNEGHCCMQSIRRTGQTVIIMFYAKFSKIVKYSALNKKKTKSLATPISYYVIDKGLVMFSYKNEGHCCMESIRRTGQTVTMFYAKFSKIVKYSALNKKKTKSLATPISYYVIDKGLVMFSYKNEGHCCMQSIRRTGQTVIIMFYAKFSKIVKYSALNKKKTKSLATPISYYVIDKGLVMFSYKNEGHCCMQSIRRTGQTVIIMFYAKFSKIVKYSALNKKKTKSLATPISYYVIDKGLVMFSYKNEGHCCMQSIRRTGQTVIIMFYAKFSKIVKYSALNKKKTKSLATPISYYVIDKGLVMFSYKNEGHCCMQSIRRTGQTVIIMFYAKFSKIVKYSALNKKKTKSLATPISYYVIDKGLVMFSYKNEGHCCMQSIRRTGQTVTMFYAKFSKIVKYSALNKKKTKSLATPISYYVIDKGLVMFSYKNEGHCCMQSIRRTGQTVIMFYAKFSKIVKYSALNKKKTKSLATPIS
ncbi:hypothetical protein TcasGA2_TC006917 [Tribolium castaneum]|uniref:Uncharacterized protein n=1 Tax=Tribolium castaneum TaxID=7070 RepID=D7GY55_TRICA|nr:hypothetical protein TcasGA2_TC006917 [Tribolium castaneum]